MKKYAVMLVRWAHGAHSRFLAISAVIAAAVFAIGSAGTGLELARAAAPQEPHTRQPAVVKQVANDLYFFYDYDGSNSVFNSADDGRE